MRRFVCLLFLLLMSASFGMSIVGCGHKSTPPKYCPGFTDAGPVAGQVAHITLASTLATTGESLNYGQIGQVLNATATDCFGTAVSISTYTYATSDPIHADINPSTGSVCGGQWNVNSGGSIANYSICTPTNAPPTGGVAFVTASAGGATSNAIPVYVHPQVGSVELGPPSAPAGTTPTNTFPACGGGDDATNCCTNTSTNTTTVVSAAPYYIENSAGIQQVGCLSQNAPASVPGPSLIAGPNKFSTAQLFARVYDESHNNITCEVGHLAFSLNGNTTAANIDENGIITAGQPGSALVTATVSNSSTGSSVGYYSTCPPASITLTAVNQTGSNINVNLNNQQALTATVFDTAGFQLQGTTLEFNSSSPRIAPVSATGVVTPAFPGVVNVTASCQPPSCNTSPFSQIGYLGNGMPLTSNGITVNAVGSSSQVIYVGSTNSQYFVSEDFTTGQLSPPVKLPYTPNSMVISQDGTSIYLGSPQALMSIATATNSVSLTNTALPGQVVGISPDGSTIALTDPTRDTISLVNPSAGTITTSYGGVATAAQWTPDNLTVYITLANGGGLLTYSTFTGWQTASGNYNDVAVTVPSLGAYFAGPQETDGRTACPATTDTSSSTLVSTGNVFYPVADVVNFPTDHIIATTDGIHIIGAAKSGEGSQTTATLQDILPVFPAQTVTATGAVVPAACLQPPNKPPTPSGYYTHSNFTVPLSSITASTITGVVPATNTSSVAVTYTGTGGVLPLYVPAAKGQGTLGYVKLSSGATAPVAGVYSTDNATFYAGTSGDNQVHVISVANGVGTDTGVITPKLPDANNNVTVPNLIVQRPRKTLAQ